ncbi:MAG: NfeD family protein [Minwuia sp.]|nr:NfeD family protein [Minwuia sp.]
MFVINLLQDHGHWTWASIGLVLIVVEVAAPGAFFLWVGIAAGVTGLLVAVIPDFGWQVQLAVFAVLSVVSTILGRRYFRWRPIRTTHTGLNRRGTNLVGREYVLQQAIVNGGSRLQTGGTTWQIEGPDLAAGESVRVTAINGTCLVVEKA